MEKWVLLLMLWIEKQISSGLRHKWTTIIWLCYKNLKFCITRVCVEKYKINYNEYGGSIMK